MLYITSAFQLAGYRHVTGTLWPVDDRTARRVATEVYSQLTDNGARFPATEKSAIALYHAVRRLRAENSRDPVQWTAHIHTGG